MGDYSRDTYRLTNAVHQLLTGSTVSGAQHYVGVRLQQGVPMLDADWNELEDIRNMELAAVLRLFIGDGVPTQSAGFAISESGVANDFAIGPGVVLANGLLAINLVLTTYSTQPFSTGQPPLTTPPGGSDRTDIAYLDIWHEEVRGSGSGTVDPRLINDQIGVETTTRVARRWQVRVRESAADLVGLPVPAGHQFTPLALLHRRAGIAAIREAMIEDRRRPGLTLTDHLKAPLYLRRGLEVLDAQRFVQMASALRTVLFSRLQNDQLPYQTAAPNAQRKETLILMSLQDLSHLARVGEIDAASGNFDNANALNFLRELYTSQSAWVGLVESLGNAGGVAQSFVNGYRQRLDGTPPDPVIKGIKPALDQDDLLAAVIAQETLNLWLTAPTGELPEGSAVCLYQSVIPVENLTAGSSYDFTYQVSANFVSPQATETFQVQVTLPAAFGTAVANPVLVTFTAPEDQATVKVTVVPSGSSTTADLDVTLFAVRNATLRSPQPSLTLTLNAPPPVAAYFYYTGARFNIDGRLEIPQSHLTRAQGRNILFRLQNTSASETRTFQVTGQIAPSVADTSGWSPLTPTALPALVVNPGAGMDVNVHVDGPKSPNPAPPLGTLGNITAVATLTQVNGAPPVDAPPPVTITIPFVVV
jgi:hypothetical protein